MKIALISPQSTFLGNNKKLSEFWSGSEYTKTYRAEWSGLSVALCIIAALTPMKHEVEIIDENVEEIDFTKHYDLVGITCITQQATRAYEIADEWKSRSVKVVLGGIHVSILPEEAKNHADSVVIGEAENIWGQLLTDFENNRLKNFYKSAEAADISLSPIPRYDLLKNKNYNLHWIQTTRGCPFDCIFCAASKVYGYKFRTKKTDQIIKEIEVIKKLFPDSRISFADDNIFINRKFSKELFERIIPYNIRYMAQTDISIAKDDELLKLIKKSGCTFLLMGFESLSEENLENIDRNNKKQKYLKLLPEYIKKVQSNGVGIMGSFIIGLKEDRSDTFDRITDFVTTNNLYNTQLSILTPFPGTEIRKELVKEKRILKTKWENYTGYDVNFVHEHITKEQFENGMVKSYRILHSKEFYLQKMMYFKKIHSELMKT